MALKSTITLQPHQQRAADKAVKGRGQILNWGLGSGKTLGAMAMAERRGGPVLVVTPASLQENFKKQLEQFVPEARRRDYVIMSYEKFRRRPEAIVAQVGPRTLIADEFHRLRNPRPREPFEKVRGRVPYVIGLTGSLINNRPEEIVPLTNLAAGKRVFESQKQFAERYIDKKKVGPGFLGWVMGARAGVQEGLKNRPELAAKTRPHVDRFTGSQAYRAHVPRVVEDRVEVVMTPAQESMYRALSSRNPILAYKMKHNLPPSKRDLSDMNAFLSASRQIMNNPGEYTVKKTDDVLAMSPKFKRQVEDIEARARGDKNFRAVIYSNFLSSGIEPVVTELNRRGIKSKTFTGRLTDKERQAAVRDLNAGRIKVLGLSPAGGEGLDLKGVRLVQLTEEHWNPERAAQAIGRSARYKSHAHLPEAQRRVDVNRYLAVHRPTLANRFLGTKRPMSTDEWIDARRREKLELNRAVLDAIGESGAGRQKNQ